MKILRRFILLSFVLIIKISSFLINKKGKCSNSTGEAGFFYEQKLLNGIIEVGFDTIKPEYFKCNNLSSDKVILRFFPKVNCDGVILTPPICDYERFLNL